jgi:hypothetical protein
MKKLTREEYENYVKSGVRCYMSIMPRNDEYWYYDKLSDISVVATDSKRYNEPAILVRPSDKIYNIGYVKETK